MLIHTDEKPFVCEYCHMTFRQKQLLARHCKVYHTTNYEPPQPRKKDHICPHCEKAFAFNGNLIRHMEMHDPSSQVSLEKQKLRMGRMKRLRPDGSLVTVTKLNEYFQVGDGYINEETQQQGNEEESQIYEEEYEEEEEEEEEEVYEEGYEEYNEGQIQYVYEDFEEDEGQQQQVEQEIIETKPNVAVQTQYLSMRSVAEKKPQISTIAVKQENMASEQEMEDEQSFMVIEVMQDEEEVVVDNNDQEPVASQHHVINRNINRNNTINTVISKLYLNIYCFFFINSIFLFRILLCKIKLYKSF